MASPLVASKVEKVPHEQRLMLEAAAAAEMLSISVQTLEKLPILRVTLPGTRCVRYPMEELKRYVRAVAAGEI